MLAITFNNVLAIEHVLPIGHHDEAVTIVAEKPAGTSSLDTGAPPATAATPKTSAAHTHQEKVRTGQDDSAGTAPASDPVNPSASEPVHHTDAHGEAHVQHCHISPSTCAEQPIPTGPGQMLFAEPLLRAVSLQLIVAEEATTTLTALSIDPLTPPPKI